MLLFFYTIVFIAIAIYAYIYSFDELLRDVQKLPVALHAFLLIFIVPLSLLESILSTIFGGKQV